MANILTISRMVFSLILLLPPAFSTSFAVIYFLAGLTDMLDGWVARRTGTVSETAAIGVIKIVNIISGFVIQRKFVAVHSCYESDYKGQRSMESETVLCGLH